MTLTELLLGDPLMKTVTTTGLFLTGASIGGFLLCWSYRRLRDISVVTQSDCFCDSCKHRLTYFDSAPIFSYLVFKGKCRYCGAKRTAFYPFLESICALVTVLPAVAPEQNIFLLMSIILAVYLFTFCFSTVIFRRDLESELKNNSESSYL